ncbi:bifunctional adenosylcobinamide kinase/adenosylcobinamide-phosphate guanylyltransferase [Klebsiella pneumoniae]|nr:bifunctional adenosylcobinamide kinase/adenosylcobinamide-phosphate guanylyltransferase [Klebsiella pneumoniae]
MLEIHHHHGHQPAVRARRRQRPGGWDYAAMERAIDDEIGVLIAACQRCPAHVVLVTNEVGMGIVPENRLARHFRDIAGRVNQRLAAAADAVWLVVSGIGVKSNNSIAG